MSHSGADDLWHFKTTHLDWFRLLAGKGHTLKVSFLTFLCISANFDLFKLDT